jgi:hypothetical protein
MESFPQNNKNDIEKLPDLFTNEEGKKYEYQKHGTFYGGDYLPEPPQEINLDIDTPVRGISEEEKKQQEDNTDLPPPPEEINLVI